MRNRTKTVCWAIAGWLVLAVPPAGRAEGPGLEESLRAFVIEVIRDNPEVVYEVLNDYVREQKRQKEKDQMEAGFANRVADSVQPGNPTRGPATAPVTMIAYTDFQCPYCSRAAKTVEALLARYPDRVRLVFKNLPLKFHPEAVPAAKAALAAHRQGRFWDYHDRLFADSKQLGEAFYVQVAADLGLDMARFDADRHSAEIAEQVKADAEQAKKLKITATPTFILNGVMVQGARSLPYFSNVVDRLLDEREHEAPPHAPESEGEAAGEGVEVTPKGARKAP